MKLSWTAAASFICTQLLGGLALSPLPSLANDPSPLNSSTHVQSTQSPSELPVLTQQPPTTAEPIDQELLLQLAQCLQETLPTSEQPSMEALQVASMQCVFQVVMLAPDGSIRPDADRRLTALLRATGTTLPKPTSQGQAVVELQLLPDSLVFTLPVTLGGRSRPFLFDTGASNSIIASEVAQELGITGITIPPELLENMVVGDNCTEVNATLHSLPILAVDAARVSGLNGMGLPITAIPGSVSGVLGIDFLSGFDVLLNPKTQQLQLLPPSSPNPDAIALTGKLGVMTVPVEVDGQGPFTFLLDTGAEYTVITEDLANQLAIDPQQAEEVQVLGFCGTETARQTTLDRVSLQEHQATNLDTVILKPGVLDTLGVDGIIGQNFLNQYQQHWQFSEPNELGFPERGSLLLSPLE